jgi:uncharacterized cupredoxin-like copper-binding protein
MRRRTIVIPLAAAVAVAGFGTATLAGSTGNAAGGTVNVTLKEWKLTPKPLSLTAGKVTFVVRNTGTTEHELIVFKTNTAPNKLPVGKDSRVNEDAYPMKVDMEVHPGKSRKVTVSLKKGKYVFLCNLAGHYKKGQYAGFTVK